MKRAILVLLSSALAVPALSTAAPAPWYLWRSKLNGNLACTQTPLGPGWEKFSGPYRDGRCEKPMVIK